MVVHEQLSRHYPSYKKFFCKIVGVAALAFWETYPSQKALKEATEQDIMTVLSKASSGKIGKSKAKTILEHVAKDGSIEREHQDQRDYIVRSYVRSIRFNTQEIDSIDKQLELEVKRYNITLETIPGVATVTAAKLLAEIKDVSRFKTSNHLASYAGIAPVTFSSASKGTTMKSRQGNRRLNGVFFFIAMQQIHVNKAGKKRNPAFHSYYEIKQNEGKEKKQAIVCISRKMVNIVYSMLKHNTPYKMPQVQQQQVS